MGIAGSGRAASRIPPIQGAFAAATLARGLCLQFADMLLGYHLHVSAGLASGATGMLLLVLLLVGAVADLAAGIVLKRYESRGGTILAMQRSGAVVAAVALVALFLPHIGLVGGLLWGTVFRVAFAFYAVPQTTLLSILPGDAREQRLYVALHGTFGSLARLATAAATLLMVGGGSPWFPDAQMGWAIAIAGLAVLTAVQLDWVARPLMPPTFVGRPSASSSTDLIPGLAWYLLAIAFHAGALFTLSRLLLFTPGVVFGVATGSAMTMAWAIGMTIGPWLALRRRYDVVPLTIVMAVVATVPLVSGAPIALRLAGSLIYGAGLGASGAALLGAVARQVRRRPSATDGMTFAAVALVIKLAMAAGNGVLGLFLDGYASGARGTGIALTIVNVGGAALCLAAWRRAASCLPPAAPSSDAPSGGRHAPTASVGPPVDSPARAPTSDTGGH